MTQAFVGQHVVHAIRQQHKHVAHLQIALQVIHNQRVPSPQNAQQLMLEIRMVHRVVVGQLGQLARSQQIRPGIANMRQRVRLPTQHQRCECCQAHQWSPLVV